MNMTAGAQPSLRELTESLRAVRRLVAHLNDTRELELRRLAREMHDELGHQLTALKFDLVSLERELQRSNSSLAARATTMKGMFDHVIASVRRISSELRPMLLDDFGLAAAVEWQVEAFAERTGIETELAFEGDQEGISPAIQTAMFRILQESLENASRHAHAAHVRVAIERADGALRLEVSDDGHGFDQRRLDRRPSNGITSMRERALALGGAFVLQTTEGKGTTVRVTVPFDASGR
jgi:signal transduction histidine kinase